MATLKRVNPAVVVHDVAALVTLTLATVHFFWVTEVAHYFSFPCAVAIVRMIAILKPLCGLNDYWFLSKFHIGLSSWLSGLNFGTRLPVSLGFGNGGKGHVMLAPFLGWH